ncbi:MAG: DUF1156 domain-containing protein [Rhizobiaceae bacterium]
MNAPIRKKLIEVSIPLEAINKASAREKSIRHGHPSTLHLWWARRPLAACRAILFAQLVDDPSSWPDRFPTEAEQEAERLRLHGVIEKMVPWEASNDDAILNAARWEIARSVAWGLGEEPPAKDDGGAILAYLQEKAPPVYDPFSGGGSIPLEAQRLGLRAYGSDLNPVAVLIGKALVEIPPKFAGRPPANPKAQAELKRGGRWNGSGAQGLAEDVRYYGQWMRDEAEKRIGYLYPKAKLPDGSEATVIAWIWARTVRSPDPAANGAMVPLVSNFMLSTKEGKKVWAEPVIDTSASQGWRFEVRTGTLSKADEEKKKKGMKADRGQAFICVLTGSPIERTYIQVEGKAGRIGRRLMAIVADGRRGRHYLAATAEHETINLSEVDTNIVSEARNGFLSASTPTRAEITGGVCSAYGLSSWGLLFCDRQLIGLVTLADTISRVRERVAEDAEKSGFARGTALCEGGVGALAYGDAVATNLAFSLDKLADLANTLVRWEPAAQCPRQLFGRQGMPMIWDYAEGNIFSDSSGGIRVIVEGQAKSLSGALGWHKNGVQGAIDQLDAAKNSYPVRPVVISTDPPYYDNIGYAVLADFFYVWLKRSISDAWPELFRRLATPKEPELVATPSRHGGQDAAEAFFMAGMSDSMKAMGAASAKAAPLTIYYAFKQSETGQEGVTSAGWASFLQAIHDSGLAIDGTWPVRTENASRMVSQGSNALASSIVLVCRKQQPNASSTDASGFTAALKRELPEAIAKIRAAGVGPVDMQQSVIGPGMGVFTRYAEVLEDDDSKMRVKKALTIINRVWEEIDNELVGTFDAETQVALAWFASYGFDPKPSGELITLANAKNTATDDLFRSDVFTDLKGRAALTPRDTLDPKWSPVRDRQLTVWECVQHLARTLAAEDGGAQAAARLIVEMGPKATDARALLDRLFQIATNKGWAQEALVYSQLAEEWPHLLDRTANISDELRSESTTGDLFA